MQNTSNTEIKNEKSIDSDQDGVAHAQTEQELKRKRKAEYQKAYRQRQKGKTEKKIDKLAAERQKKYRERNKHKNDKSNSAQCKKYRYKLQQKKFQELQEAGKNNEVPIKKQRLGNEKGKGKSQQEVHQSIAQDELEDNTPIYSNYYRHSVSHIDFLRFFKNNTFGHTCAVCDRLWWKNDLKTSSSAHKSILKTILGSRKNVDICSTCKAALDKKKIPLLSTYNGFSYPKFPSDLPALNLVEQRLISPRIPFMQIRRLRHCQNEIFGQIINVPIEVDTMLKLLPRNVEDDYCCYVNLEKKLIHKTSNVDGLINKGRIKEWLSYLVTTPLYIHHNIKIDDSFLTNSQTDVQTDDITEHIPPEDNVISQQQILLFNEDKLLNIAPNENITPLFDEYAQELCFPTIYGGQFRSYRGGITVTPFMQAASELRRTDRRAADPQHLLYLAAKTMRHRVNRWLSVALKNVGSDTEKVQSKQFNCLESNLAFLRCIPNSAWYWSDRKKDLFAMIRQLGTPTAFMSLTANETGWNHLLKLLYKLVNGGEIISDEDLARMSCVQKAKLVSGDAVTCAIYFQKLVNSLLKILQSKKRSPFGEHRVVHYFKRIEFQHDGSPQAHILLWLDNVPKNLLCNDSEVIQLIDELVSVSESQASGKITLQRHKHTFMPSKKTITLTPMKETNPKVSEESLKEYKNHFKLIKANLEKVDYKDFDEFYTLNNIFSDEHYNNIISAGIHRPKLFYKRTPSEKWNNPFNPFVFHHLESSMNFHIIQDEYNCAAYIVEYVNKHKRPISNLQTQMNEIMDKHPEFDIGDIAKKMSIDVLQSVEMTVQEAAWYLLREPMATSSVDTVYIPTIFANERQKIIKSMKELNALDEDCTDICKDNWFDKYEKRPDELKNVTLAQFVAKYYINQKGTYSEREHAKIIRYRNYDMSDNYDDYRREMVLLHIPFRNEENDVVADNKFIQIYEENKDLILERRKEFECDLVGQKTWEICKQLCGENEEEKEKEDEEIISTTTPSPPPPQLTGRRIVDINFFFQQFASLVPHGPENCQWTNLEFIKETLFGLSSTISFKCKKCNHEGIVLTDSDPTAFNDLAVNSCLNAEIDQTQFHSLCSTLNIPNNCTDEFERVASDTRDKVWESMRNAAQEEATLARQELAVDSEDRPLVPIIVDNCLDLETVAIYGQRTKKLLYFDVEKKFCTICARADALWQPAESHQCFKNCGKTSREIRNALICQAFEKSLEFYGIIYNKLLGDEDGSLNIKLFMNKPYGNLMVETSDNYNGLLRKYRSELTKLTFKSENVLPVYKNALKPKIADCCECVLTAVKFWSAQNIDEKCDMLQEDIFNIASHVFDEHKNCINLKSYCDKVYLKSELVNGMRKCGYFDKIVGCSQELLINTQTLLIPDNNIERDDFFSELFKYVKFPHKIELELNCLRALLNYNNKTALNVTGEEPDNVVTIEDLSNSK